MIESTDSRKETQHQQSRFNNNNKTSSQKIPTNISNEIEQINDEEMELIDDDEEEQFPYVDDEI